MLAHYRVHLTTEHKNMVQDPDNIISITTSNLKVAALLYNDVMSLSYSIN